MFFDFVKTLIRQDPKKITKGDLNLIKLENIKLTPTTEFHFILIYFLQHNLLFLHTYYLDENGSYIYHPYLSNK